MNTVQFPLAAFGMDLYSTAVLLCVCRGGGSPVDAASVEAQCEFWGIRVSDAHTTIDELARAGIVDIEFDDGVAFLTLKE